MAKVMDFDEPTMFKQASKEEAWQHAMDEEYDALIKNDTWNSTTLLTGHKVIGSKLVYTLNMNQDGSLDNHKAKLAAK
eukprot:c4778_g1_i1 orf=2-232(-)